MRQLCLPAQLPARRALRTRTPLFARPFRPDASGFWFWVQARPTGESQHCCGDGLCEGLENEERCPVDCAGIIVNGMLGPGTYNDPRIPPAAGPPGPPQPPAAETVAVERKSEPEPSKDPPVRDSNPPPLALDLPLNH